MNAPKHVNSDGNELGSRLKGPGYEPCLHEFLAIHILNIFPYIVRALILAN